MKRGLSLGLILFLSACGGAQKETVPPEQPVQPAQPAQPQPQAEKPKEPEKPAKKLSAYKPVPQDTLLPRKLFSGNPDMSLPRVSPDGKWIAYLAPVSGVMNIYVGPFDFPEKSLPLTNVTDRPLREYFWAYDSSAIIYLKDTAGDENFHMYAVDVKSKKARDLTNYPKTRAMFIENSPKKPGELLVGLNDRDEKVFDVYRLNIKTGKRTLVFKNDDAYAGFTGDRDLNLRLASKSLPDGSSELFDVSKKGKAVSFGKIPMEDAMTTEPWAFDMSGKTLFMLDSRGRDTAAMMAVDWATKKSTVIAEDPKADIQEALFDMKTGAVQAAAVNYDRLRWKIVDKKLEPVFALIQKELKGDISFTGQNKDATRFSIVEKRDDGVPAYYAVDLKNNGTALLGHQRKGLTQIKLAKMHPHIVKARDGLELVTYVSIPPFADPDGDGKPDRPMPAVLLVHGGPWARDQWGFSSTVQWLASRGYATVQVNFRGSRGFGKAFVNAGDGQWGANMHNDLLDAVKWAADAKLIDATRVAIYGGSYGGYSTLAGLTMTPDTFACGVDIVGPSNLVTLLETIPPYWAPELDMFVKRIGGDHRTDEGKKFLSSRSPLTYADKIVRPLLIGQGANDPRVKQSESDQIVKAMQAKNIPVTYVLFSDEGHGFARPENALAFNAVAETFLAQCIGGPYQPIGEDFKNSSIAVPAGADDVEGLKEKVGGS